MDYLEVLYMRFKRSNSYITTIVIGIFFYTPLVKFWLKLCKFDQFFICVYVFLYAHLKLGKFWKKISFAKLCYLWLCCKRNVVGAWSNSETSKTVLVFSDLCIWLWKSWKKYPLLNYAFVIMFDYWLCMCYSMDVINCVCILCVCVCENKCFSIVGC